MQARMRNPALVVPDAMPALQALGAAIGNSGLPQRTVELVHLRASQMNGCGTCVLGGVSLLKKAGETDERLATVAAWRDAPFFSDAERAALALAEATTKISENGGAVPDEVWNEAARHYDEPQLAALILAIANINVWNRLNIATRQVAGVWMP